MAPGSAPTQPKSLASLGQYFDLIAGTSAGWIIALGLGLGLSARDILALYVEKGLAIFGQGNGAATDFVMQRVGGLRRLIRPKCGSDALRGAL